LGALGIVLLSFTSPAAVVILALCLVSLGVGALTLFLPNAPKLPGVLRLVGFAVASNLAGVIAWADVLRREHVAIWEPTRRDG
jgi:hypothetical protein